MTLPVTECIAHIRDTLGGTKQLPAVGAYRILNDAGHYLVNAHHWSWCQGGAATLNYEANVPYVWLPRDFRDLIGINATSGLTAGMEPTTLQGIIDRRTESIDVSTTFRWYAITYAPRARPATGTVTFAALPDDGDTITIDDGLNPPLTFEFDKAGDGVTTGNVLVDISASGADRTTAAANFQTAIEEQRQGEAPTGQALIGVLEIDATVSSAVVSLTNRIPGTEGNVDMTQTGAPATLVGMRGGSDGGRPEARLEIWPTPTADDAGALTVFYRRGWHTLDQDEEEVSIPEWLESVYLALVRAHARGYVREDVADLNTRVAAIRTGPLMRAAVQRDAEIQAEFGVLEGGAGAAEEGAISWPFNFTGTSDPA